MLAYLLYAFCGGFAAFLVGMAMFMYRENRKFGDNQFTMKLLPPPSRLNQALPGATPSITLSIDDRTAGAARPVEPSRAAAPQAVTPPV